MRISILILTIFLVSCSESREVRAKHQAETGYRITKSQENTDSLFKELE